MHQYKGQDCAPLQRYTCRSELLPQERIHGMIFGEMLELCLLDHYTVRLIICLNESWYRHLNESDQSRSTMALSVNVWKGYGK